MGVTTLRDVARQARVSVTTASRALNGYSDVNARTRTRVEGVARRLGYRRDMAARSLVGAPSGTVGLILVDRSGEGLLHPFSAEVIAGIHRGLTLGGRDLLIFGPDSVSSRDFIGLCRAHRVEGAICGGLDRDDPVVAALAKDTLSCVLLDIPVEGPHLRYVTSQNRAGSELATEHLLALGHRRVGHVAGASAAWVSGERVAGYRVALGKRGVRFDPALVREADFTRAGGREAAAELLRMRRAPTAIFAASDALALGVIDAAVAAGLRVPEDLSVVGFDDVPAFAGDRLTTVRQRRYEMGLGAARLLMAMLRKEDVRPVVLPVDLVVRHTTGPPRDPAAAAPSASHRERED